jgi:hypothetical protein
LPQAGQLSFDQGEDFGSSGNGQRRTRPVVVPSVMLAPRQPADLQLAAALPHVPFVEFIGGSAYIDRTLNAPFHLDKEGFLASRCYRVWGWSSTQTNSHG